MTISVIVLPYFKWNFGHSLIKFLKLFFVGVTNMILLYKKDKYLRKTRGARPPPAADAHKWQF